MNTPTMKAARIHDFGDADVIQLDTVDVPDPGPGQVRVRVESAALNHLDLWVRRGLPIDIQMPHVGGSDLAGVVDAVATAGDEDAAEVAVGTRVVVDPSMGYGDPSRLRLIGEHVDGGFAHYAIVPAANVVEIPRSVDFDTAAAASLAGVTAWRGLVTRGGLLEGETVLVTGASGGVSTMAIQFAKARGARVMALTSTPWVERVRGLGADVVLDRLHPDWMDRARAALDGAGVDVVLDSVGAALWESLTRLLGPCGRLVSYGATTGAKVQIDLRHHFWKQTAFLGSTMGTPQEYRAAMAAVFRGDATPVIHTRMGLDRLADAHRLLEAGEVFGKVVIHPWGNMRSDT